MAVNTKSRGLSRLLARDHISLDEVADSWVKIFNELDYAASKKRDIYEGYDRQYGRDHWQPAHIFEGEVISWLQACHVYEESYHKFLKDFPEIREWLVNSASDVFDIAESNVHSGLDYSIQECDAVHLQDIAIRRALTRLALEEMGTLYDENHLPDMPIFNGNKLVQVRGKGTDGYKLGLNPGHVPFHGAEASLDTNPHTGVWWEKGSVEEWYQKSKIILVDPSKLTLTLEYVGDHTLIFEGGGRRYSAERSAGLSNSLRNISAGQLLDDSSLVTVVCSPTMPYSEWSEQLSGLTLPYDGTQDSLVFDNLLEEAFFTAKYNVAGLAQKDPFDIASIGPLSELGIVETYAGIVSAVLGATFESYDGLRCSEHMAIAGTGKAEYFFDGDEPAVEHWTAFKGEPSGRFKKGDISVYVPHGRQFDAAVRDVFAAFYEIQNHDYVNRDPSDVSSDDLCFKFTGETTSLRLYLSPSDEKYFVFEYITPEGTKVTAKTLTAHN